MWEEMSTVRARKLIKAVLRSRRVTGAQSFWAYFGRL